MGKRRRQNGNLVCKGEREKWLEKETGRWVSPTDPSSSREESTKGCSFFFKVELDESKRVSGYGVGRGARSMAQRKKSRGGGRQVVRYGKYSCMIPYKYRD